MRSLLDTDVVSELRTPARRRHPAVVAWMRRQGTRDLHLSVVTIFELQLGIERLAHRDPGQSHRLAQWLEGRLLPEFGRRVLDVDVTVARTAAPLHVPDPRCDRDAFIAATALVHGLTVVTRNVRDFAGTGVRVVDPWEASGV